MTKSKINLHSISSLKSINLSIKLVGIKFDIKNFVLVLHCDYELLSYFIKKDWGNWPCEVFNNCHFGKVLSIQPLKKER